MGERHFVEEKGNGAEPREVLRGVAALGSPHISKEKSLGHAQSTACHHRSVPRAQHCWCNWSGLVGPDPWDWLVKGKEKCRGLCDQGTAGDYVQCPCHPGAACAVCSTKLKNVRIWVPALTAAMKDGNGAVHMEAGFSLPKAMLASPHPHITGHHPREPPLPGPALGCARLSTAEDIQGHHQKPSHCCGM